MAASGDPSKKNPHVWVWSPAAKGQDAFSHPADIPFGDEKACQAVFGDGRRGPRVARISLATVLERLKGDRALVAEKGATREVPMSMILPWYEGVLLLEELVSAQGKSGQFQAAWLTEDLKTLLEQARGRRRKLNSSGYTEERLLDTSATGMRVLDSADREWSYRRKNVKSDAGPIPDGADQEGFYGIKEILDYLPPWEAFTHEKCGFYQDFYQVKWRYPFSEVDYSSVENGCASVQGVTWEPDECLPAFLDPLRLAAKRAWVKRRREQEGVLLREQESKPFPAPAAAAAAAAAAVAPIKKRRPNDAPPPPAKMARKRRDGDPLERDLLRAEVGHDFVPEGVEMSRGQIRSGWPKEPQDYPAGFAVAQPPGFCSKECDCMDDARAQKASEVRKDWLEEPDRTAAARGALDNFGKQTHFLNRRGECSQQWHFEPTVQATCPDHARARAALDLAQRAEKAVRAAMQEMPAGSLLPDADPVRIPGRAFFTARADHPPLRYSATLIAGAALPPWCSVQPNDGRLVVSKLPSAQELPVKLRLDLWVPDSAEAVHGTCTMIAGRFAPSQTPWSTQTAAVAKHYDDPQQCPLERGVRDALLEHFSKVFDFKRRAPRELSLGVWLDAMVRILVMLRAAAGANLALTPVSKLDVLRQAL